jgi:hypothetical protein
MFMRPPRTSGSGGRLRLGPHGARELQRPSDQEISRGRQVTAGASRWARGINQQPGTPCALFAQQLALLA